MRIRPRSVLAWGFLSLAACAASGCRSEGGQTASEASPVSMVLITVDGLAPARLALYGGATESAALSRLAAAGTAWSDVWTTCPMTRPAVATYLTGLAPDVHGVREDLFIALPPDRPTLSEVLAAAGYRTAAFPDSSMLGRASGLLRGFAVVDDPEPIPMAPSYWLPVLKQAGQVADDFEAWLDLVPETERYFAWVHFTGPLLDQIGRASGSDARLRPEDSSEPGETGDVEANAQEPGVPPREAAPTEETVMSRLDAALGEILDALEARGDWSRTAVILAGTQADVLGGETEPAGSGFSLRERAIRVPLIARLPGGSGTARPAEAPVWAPDVTATLASLGGVRLPGTEGIDLRQETPADRIVFAWSWAPRDQMGWRPLRAARSGPLKWLEGFADGLVRLPDEVETHDDAAADRLRRALSARANPAPPAVDLASVRDLLVAKGLEFEPLPPEGREFGPLALRRDVADKLMAARRHLQYERPLRASKRLRALRELDPDNLSGLLSFGQIQAMGGTALGRELTGRAVELEPTNPEFLHWYAHALWRDSWADAESILEAIRPFRQDDPDVLYDLACARSLAGDLPKSAEYLSAAVRAGYTRWPHVESDPDLRNLRKSEHWSAVLREFSR